MDNGKKDSENNQSSEQKGIFSTPDLTVNTENLPQNQPTKPASAAPRFNFGRRANRGNTSAESSERVASAFAQTDASQQAERLSDAMLESANATTRSTATGDIQLDVPKKKKRWPWAAGILLVLVGVGALTYYLVAIVGDTSESKQEVVIKEPFYQYFNYLVNGEEATTAPKFTLSQVNETALVSAVYSNSSEEKRAFFSRAQELLSAFVQAANHNAGVASTSMNTTILTLAESSQAQFNTLKEYSSVTQIEYPNMIYKYIHTGADPLITSVQEAYKVMEESSDSVLSDIAYKKNLLAEAVVTVFNAYAAGGCINAEEVVETCTEQLTLDDSATEAKSLIEELNIELLTLTRQPIINVLSGCQNMTGVLDGTISISGEEE